MVPRSSLTFDPTRQLARGDLISAPPGLQVILKWTKSIQTRGTYKTVPICTIPGSPLCPVANTLAYMQRFPANDNDPMFHYFNKGQKVIIGEKHVRGALKAVLMRLNINPSQHGFHTFRRSGASLAFHLGVPLQDIQAHGTWLSDAVWSYIQPSTINSPVIQAFTSNLTP